MRAHPALVFLSCLLGAAAAVSAAPGAWIDVPFVAQTPDGCGSAVISMVMHYWDVKAGEAPPASADVQRIQTALYQPSQKGILASAMAGYFDRFGFRTFAFHGDWDQLQHHLHRGRPLIVSLRASAPLRELHYVVVVGIDASRAYVFVNDPAQQKMLRISRAGFESEWNPTHNWTLLAVPRSDN